MRKPLPERWLPIERWPDYEVSDFGRVRRATDSPSANCKRGHILLLKKPSKHTPYLSVGLTFSGQRQRYFSVHVLVCTAFHGPKPFPKAQVRHLDGCHTHNHYQNLIWGSQKENSEDMLVHGTGKRLLTTDQAHTFRRQYQEVCPGGSRAPYGWLAQKAVEYGVSRAVLWNIAHEKGYLL